MSKYKNGLPSLNKDDIIILEYNSNDGYIKFGKEIDSRTITIAILNNLPKNQDFYWIVGHEHDPMVVKILEF